MNDLPDLEADAKTGVLSLAVLLGEPMAEKLVTGLRLACVACCFASGLRHRLGLLVWTLLNCVVHPVRDTVGPKSFITTDIIGLCVWALQWWLM